MWKRTMASLGPSSRSSSARSRRESCSRSEASPSGPGARGPPSGSVAPPAPPLPPPQQIETKAARDRDEPRQDGPLRVEPLEVDEGTHERVLSEILSVGRPGAAPHERGDRP